MQQTRHHPQDRFAAQPAGYDIVIALVRSYICFLYVFIIQAGTVYHAVLAPDGSIDGGIHTAMPAGKDLALSLLPD